MKFTELKSMIIPFINVRGWDIIYPYTSLDIAIHNAIQQIFNEYNWSCLFTSVELKAIDFTESISYVTHETIWPIKRVEFVMDNTTGIYLKEAKNLTELTDNHFLRFWDYIILTKARDCTLWYYKWYLWDIFQATADRDLPLPNTFIPALYYLILSQIDMIEISQPDQEVRTNYRKYLDQITLLKNQDTPTTLGLIGWTRD